MYTKGDVVLYPMHGAGIIEDFEEKNIDGVVRNYYVLNIPLGNLKVMLCEDNIESANLRKIMEYEYILNTLESVANSIKTPLRSESWNQRHKDNMEKIKTGDFEQTAVVFYELYNRERERGLSSAEKKILTTAKKIIMSEIMLSYGVDKHKAEEVLEKYVNFQEVI